MEPENGKWYWVSHGRKSSKRHYEGPALCIRLDEYESSKQNIKIWRFVQPDIPDRLRERMFVQDLFASRDIKREVVEPQVTATKAMNFYKKNIRNDYEG